MAEGPAETPPHASHEAIDLLPPDPLVRARAASLPRVPRTRDVAPAPAEAGSE